jgi:hypothetical protein
MTRLKIDESVTLNTEVSQAPLLITKDYFMKALLEVKPAYGKDNANLQLFLENGFYYYSPYITSMVQDLSERIQKLMASPTTHIAACLLYGTNQETFKYN